MKLKISFKHILSFLIFLSLLGLGQDIFINCPNVKYSKETEWVIKASQNGKASRCYSCKQSFVATDSGLNLKSWSNEVAFCYNQKVSIKLISQAKIFYEVGSIDLILSKLYNPRKSIENYRDSFLLTGLFSKHCLSCGISHDEENIMRNSLLTREWINQKIQISDFSRELNVWQNGSGVGYI